MKKPKHSAEIESEMSNVTFEIMQAKAQLGENLLFAYMCETQLGLDAIQEMVGKTPQGGIRTWFAPKVTA